MSYLLSPGDVLGNVEILAILTQGEIARHTHYKVRYLCCNIEGELQHKSIRGRDRYGVSTCPKCTWDKNSKAPSHSQRQYSNVPRSTGFATGPTWPPTSAGLAKHK